jgi:hypothetical protein
MSAPSRRPSSSIVQESVEKCEVVHTSEKKIFPDRGQRCEILDLCRAAAARSLSILLTESAMLFYKEESALIFIDGDHINAAAQILHFNID